MRWRPCCQRRGARREPAVRQRAVRGQAHGGALIWDVETGQRLSEFPVDTSRARAFDGDRLMNSLGVSLDGVLLATCNSSINNEFVEPVKLWNTQTCKLVRDFQAENAFVLQPAFR